MLFFARKFLITKIHDRGFLLLLILNLYLISIFIIRERPARSFFISITA